MPVSSHNLLALSIGIADGAGEGLETVVASELEESGMPDRLSVWTPATEHSRGHVVEDHPERTAKEVFKGAGKRLQERGLPLGAVEVHPELTGGCQQAAEGVDDPRDPVDLDSEGRPVDLHLLA